MILINLQIFLKEIFFESFKSFRFMFSFNITAAEITGPAKHPLPTSSTPAVIICFFNYILSSAFLSLIIFRSIQAIFF